MGHNRAGVRARARLRRHKRETMRLVKKAEQAESPGVVAKVKQVAHDAAEKVTGLVKAAAEKVTGKKKT
jgi:hypothetical protein